MNCTESGQQRYSPPMDLAAASNGDLAETQGEWTPGADASAPTPTALRGNEQRVDVLRSPERGSTSAEAQSPVEGSESDVAQVGAARAPEVLEHVYQPLLQHLESECRRVLAAAASEAEKVRSQAQDEARRILTEAHRERSALFRRASSKQALMYQEAEAEIERWLEELDEERQVVMGTAQEDAARLLRKSAEQADVDARARAWRRPTVRPRPSSPKRGRKLPSTAARRSSNPTLVHPHSLRRRPSPGIPGWRGCRRSSRRRRSQRPSGRRVRRRRARIPSLPMRSQRIASARLWSSLRSWRFPWRSLRPSGRLTSRKARPVPRASARWSRAPRPTSPCRCRTTPRKRPTPNLPPTTPPRVRTGPSSVAPHPTDPSRDANGATGGASVWARPGDDGGGRPVTTR